jgi:hypothetical protein
MNRQQLTFLLVLGVVVGGLALYMARRGTASYQTTTQLLGQRVIPEFPMNDVARIFIDDATNQVNLVRQGNRWRVRERYDYPADFSVVSGLLQKVWDMKIAQVEDVGPSQLPRLRLVEPGEDAGSGTLLRFDGAAGEGIASLVLGRQHMRQGSDPSPMGGGGWPDGRYLRVLNGGGQVVLVADALSEVEPKADRFLDKDFFRVEKLRSLAVTGPDGGAWRLVREREGGAWQLADGAEGEELDTSKVTFANNVLAYPSFVDVVDPDLPVEETGLDRAWVAELETFEGLHYAVRIGSPNEAEQYHLTVAVRGEYPRQREVGEEESEEDRERLELEFEEQLTRLDEKLETEKGYGDWTYLVSKWTVDSLLKPREDLLQGSSADLGSGFGAEGDDLGNDLDFEGLDFDDLGIFPDR